MRQFLFGIALVALSAEAFAAQPQLKAVVSCELAGPKNAVELLRGSPIVDSYVYKVRHSQKTRFIFDGSGASRGAAVQWQCASNHSNIKVLVVSGEFTSNFLQGTLFYFDSTAGQIERVDFAERNRPRWVRMSEQEVQVIFENTGNESSHKYLIYEKDGTYLELDELPITSSANGGNLIELNEPKQ
jgi:hypothetical protein